MSPGPDFAIVVKNSLISKKAGVFTALGIAIGLVIHVTYTLLGIGLIISRSILLFNVIKYLGALYLIYLGIMALKSKSQETKINSVKTKQDLNAFSAFLNGFLTNVLNPKATLFFVGVFTQIISPQTPLIIQMFYGVEVMTLAFIWFSFLALTLSLKVIKNKIGKIHVYLEKTMGVVLLALGIKVALSTTK